MKLTNFAAFQWQWRWWWRIHAKIKFILETSRRIESCIKQKKVKRLDLKTFDSVMNWFDSHDLFFATKLRPHFFDETFFARLLNYKWFQCSVKKIIKKLWIHFRVAFSMRSRCSDEHILIVHCCCTFCGCPFNTGKICRAPAKLLYENRIARWNDWYFKMILIISNLNLNESTKKTTRDNYLHRLEMFYMKTMCRAITSQCSWHNNLTAEMKLNDIIAF